MIELSKKKIGKKQLAIIITAGVLVLLIAAYVIINAVLNSLSGSGDPSGSGTPEYDAEIGESVYMNTPTVYPYLEKSRILSISVGSHKDTFTMMRAKDDEGNILNYFLFYFMDEDGNPRAYMPSIASAENNFDYTDFYSIETSDGLNATKIDYLCATVGVLYYDYKVPITAAPGSTERKNQLALYGLGDGERETILITYVDGDGNTQEYKIYVGDKLINGVGYYFMIDGRDYIYSSAACDNFSYALGGFEAFLHSRIVAEGLSSDKTFEPYLTTDYKQWKSTYKDVYYDEAGNELPYTVTEKSEVVINADIFTPIYKQSDLAGEDGYYHLGYDRITVDLSSVSDKPMFSRLVAALAGKPVDKNDSDASETLVTVVNGMNSATLYADGKGEYSYTVTAIESVLTDTAEFFYGPVLGHSLVKVIYDYSIDGVKQNDKPCHAVINLDTEKALPAGVKEAILAAEVGALASPLTFSVRYDKTNTRSESKTFVITEIELICEIIDGQISYKDKVESDSIISYSYYTVVKGSDGTETKSDVQTNQMVNLADITEGYDLNIKNALIGSTVGAADLSVPVGEVYYQPFEDFAVYSIKNIVGFVERELVSAFRFVNSSGRDSFYGESTYENTISEIDPDNPYGLYAINAENCDTVVRLLGGINPEGSSQISEGLVGNETVAVGLTPEVMEKYGLYDGYTVYFELPRGISADPNNGDDYIWAGTLGFNLYISNADENGNRYVGSDMYDIVVKIDASTFDYLDYSFPEFWARRNLAMINYTKLDKIKVNYNFPDVKGSYNFDVEHKIIYILGNQHYDQQQNGQGAEYNEINVNASIDGFVSGSASVDGVYNGTALSELLVALDKKSLSLSEVYNWYAGTPGVYEYLSIVHDTMGSSYFKEMLMVLYSTYYMGVLDTDSDEVKAALAREADFTISFNVSSSSRLNTYVYGFRRLDDRRVMVSFYMQDSTGATSKAVSDFYISDLAFEKITRNFANLLNGVTVNPDIGYE